MLDCLTNLVGLTDKDCACYSGSEPDGFDTLNDSESGYYLTDEDYGLPVLDSIYAAIDCGDANNVFTVLQRARAAALNAVYTDLQAAMLQFWDKSVRPFSGLVGQRRSSSSRTPSATTVGQLWKPQPIKDASFMLTGIWIGVTQAGAVEITVSSNDPDFTEVSQTFTVTQAGKFQHFDFTAPIELPLYSKNTENGNCCGSCGLRYTISYVPASGMKFLDNKYSCCGGHNTEWKQYINAQGFETNDLQTFLDDCTAANNSMAQGLCLEGYLACDNLQWLCELQELNGKDLRDVLARAIQFRATVFIAQHILDSAEINQWTTLNREALYGKRNHAQKRFDEYMLWIAENVPVGMTGCYKCKPSKIQRRSF